MTDLLKQARHTWLLLPTLCYVANHSVDVQSQTCYPPPPGLVAWWSGEGHAKDLVNGGSGVLQGHAGYGAGKVSLGFVFDGSGDGLFLSNPPGLQLQSFAIEAWIKRTSASQASLDTFGNGVIFGYGYGGYAFGIKDDGRLFLTKVGVSEVSSTTAVNDTNWHHVAITKASGTVVFYIDGMPDSGPSYNPGFEFSSNLMLGAVLTIGVRSSFLGLIDELSIYDTALLPAEVRSLFDAGSLGKCPLPEVTISPDGGIFTVPVTVTLTPNTTNGVIRLTTDGSLPASNSTVYEGPVTVTNTMTLTAQLYEGNTPVSQITTATFVLLSGGLQCLPTNSMVSWWTGENSPLDVIGANDGVLRNAATYRPGKIGQSFSFEGNGAGVFVGNPATLQAQTFTIGAWVRRSRIDVATLSTGGRGVIFGYGPGGYAFGMLDDGRLLLSKVGVSSVVSAGFVKDTNWHHAVVIKSGDRVEFFVDGAGENAQAYATDFDFSSTAAIGAAGDLGSSFLGQIDELVFYNRELTAEEITTMYYGTAFGSCTPPTIAISPNGGEFTNSTVVTFSTTTTNGVIRYTLDGSQPSPISTAYTGPITINNTAVVLAQLFDGNSPVSPVSRALFIGHSCVSLPSGSVGWWRAEGNTSDAVRRNTGTLLGQATYVAGKVGQAFTFDGNGDGVIIGNPPALHSQTFTIEAWVKRARTDLATLSGVGNGVIYGYGSSGYAFGMFNDGRLMLTQVGANYVASTQTITDGNWHHVAVTKAGSSIVFYIDGIAELAGAYNPTFSFGTSATIGASGDNVLAGFLGSIDELALYDRALDASEASVLFGSDTYGKCTNFPPSIFVQPLGQNVAVGSDVLLSVMASSAAPVGYQWAYDGHPIVGATNDTLTITNIQFSASGTYSVIVSNDFGSALSDGAVLAISSPPVITKQPQSQTVLIGSTAILSVIATGTAPLSYQWQVNNHPITGATSPTFIINNASLNFAGPYRILVSNSVGSVFSDVATLTVATARLSVALDQEGVTLSVVGETGATYTIEVSQDFVTWSSLVTEFNVPANWQFTDTAVSVAGQRFYRVRKN